MWKYDIQLLFLGREELENDMFGDGRIPLMTPSLCVCAIFC